MPRKNKHTAKHRGYIKPDYHSKNKKHNDESSTIKKNKLRTSLDIYKRLIHDKTLGVDLNYVSIGYEDTEDIQEMPLLDWQMIEHGGDIPIHRIIYFVLYLMDRKRIIIWDKKTRLDRLFCSGETDKDSQSLRSLLFGIHHIDEEDNKDNDEHKSNEKTEHKPIIIILDELIHLFNHDLSDKRYEICLNYNKKRVIQEPSSNTRLNRNAYKTIAHKTKQIIKDQYFIHPKTNKKINISNEMQFSYENSELYSEKHAFPYINIDKQIHLRKYHKMEIEINHETTLDCAYRLTSEYGTDINIAMLNFSSARNPGGGWDTGALAQEESIARSSVLIPTLTKYQREFYEYHKARKTMLYSHALIYSPDIVIMKHGNGIHMDGYYKCNIITSPAVNAKNYIKRAKYTDPMMKKYGELNKIIKGGNSGEKERQTAAWNVIECVMRERCKRVLELAMKYDNEYVILGAWGCGVFGNDAMMISRIFAELLRDRYHHVFRKVVFAILDQKKNKPLDKFIYQFQKVFGKKDIKYNSNEERGLDGKEKFNAYDFIQ